MEGAVASSSSSLPQFEPNIEAIKRRLLKRGVYPTPKIVHNLRKKEIQKHNRKLNKDVEFQRQALFVLEEESHFQALKHEYKEFNKAISEERRCESGGGLLVGKPWERIERVKLKEIGSGSREFNGGKLKRENLRQLKEVFEGNLKWVFDDDIDVEDSDWLRSGGEEKWDPAKRWRGEGEAIRFLVDRLSCKEVSVKDWKLAKIMKQSGLRFSEGQLLKIVEELGNKGKWSQAMAVVEWVYNDKERRDCKSRFVYTKLLSVLGKERRPQEALSIFNLMREDRRIYPDMAAYHSIAVTLGQTGLLKELVKVIECMRQRPSKRVNNMLNKNWDPVLEPDLVIYNAILNACVPSQQWKGVSWVFQQLRRCGLKPNGATYGLAMEVMLHSGKYESVHEYFRKMKKSGESLKALTYKVLVRAFWEEGRVNEAVEAVRDMEQRGVVGAASVYYELACCLCYYGRWQDAMLEVEKMKRLRYKKPLEVSLTGMIASSMDGGHIDNCISIFEHMKAHCVPNIGTINTMLKVYSRSDLFSEAKELFEDIKGVDHSGTTIIPDGYTYSSMLEVSARALQWEYFEYVYKEMSFSGYQLNQIKHAPLLVEASRSGKSHLLEHAFDEILEAGEIPHPLLFTEMVFQATAQENYERAVTLVNTMAHASFQITERQWTDLFEKNGEKISQDSLEKLLDAVGHCRMASEVTVSNLSRSLRSLCRLGSSGDLPCTNSCIEDTDDTHINTNSGEMAGNRNAYMLKTSSSMVDGNLELDEDTFVNKTSINLDMPLVNNSSTNREDDDPEAASSTGNSVNGLDVATNLLVKRDVFADDVASGASTDCLDKKLLDILLEEPAKDAEEVELEIGTTEANDLYRSELPSAHAILDVWKESRKKR
ncbi:PREDICTED: pentatricopeptide repeat-containing protein At5g67570, chloroplastic isoform X1 [Populus euphratica]|uniref:Pentatricopeptide repeat-containing protein At5g67570, chloroplastic isoform X1 n=1 Tax=Populus euphratica TaxID=75702 RepID=A0AAJ6XB50_POPEU|nr:PREDICTED: pentatricopeptide repeat-containing protein At5g67570, chloroplastic-like isoform X1 [Populus euphratica]XP_011031295.1 PREDICTED: pentatricopeptide repeat-containing protein At5g67570, chloroplastic isoform X1 [Populus euphratica]